MRSFFGGALLVLVILCAFPRSGYAAGSYKFCGRWGYTYIDQGEGEDFLLHEPGLPHAVKPAAYSWAELYRDGGLVWSGYMDASGCTGTVSGAAGSYEFWSTPEIAAPNGAVVGITPYSDWQWRWFESSYQLTATTVPTTYNSNFGIGDSVAAVAAAITQIVTGSDSGLTANVYYSVYSEEQCPGAISCYVPGDALYLGWNSEFGTWDSFFKSVVLHEFGHAIQYYQFGLQKTDYTSGDASQALCRCDQVYDPADRLHCIQSREMASAAQVEGFAHFIATITENRASDNDAIFPYYKEVLWTDGLVYWAPIAMPAYGWGQWMEQFCPGSNEGTEFDYMNFYYWINRRTSDAFSISQISSVYRSACGGANCNGSQQTTWSSLYTAVGSVFGNTSTKAAYWRNQAGAFGVDH